MASKYVNDLRVLGELLAKKDFVYSASVANQCADRMERMEETIVYYQNQLKELQDER